MENITKNEIMAILTLFKDIEQDYNANSLSKTLGITPMGTLKILKKMQSQNLLKQRKMGKAVFYKPELNNQYTRSLISFLLHKEAEESSPKTKRWVTEIKKLENIAEVGILFGSILKKDNPKDIDVLLILKPKQANAASKAIKDINSLTSKKLHIIRQTSEDLKSNIQKKNPVIVQAIKEGIVVFGQDKIIEIMQNVSN